MSKKYNVPVSWAYYLSTFIVWLVVSLIPMWRVYLTYDLNAKLLTVIWVAVILLISLLIIRKTCNHYLVLTDDEMIVKYGIFINTKIPCKRIYKLTYLDKKEDVLNPYFRVESFGKVRRIWIKDEKQRSCILRTDNNEDFYAELEKRLCEDFKSDFIKLNRVLPFWDKLVSVFFIITAVFFVRIYGSYKSQCNAVCRFTVFNYLDSIFFTSIRAKRRYN